MKLVIVESPGKVKNLSQYLGKGYKVLATSGHIRSLPSKSGSVKPHEDFALTWEILSKSEKALQAIEKSLEKATSLILATDLDREGEAISWHLLEYLRGRKLIPSSFPIQRISFNAVTAKAVLEAMAHPRHLDTDLVNAYLARLSLDYLVGFTLSPILWRKLPGSRSAGRVQSVALRMVAEREKAIQSFQTQEYWSITGLFLSPAPFEANLVKFDQKKVEKQTLQTLNEVEKWMKELSSHSYFLEDIQKKKVQRHPSAPFITSSLQQEASRKMGFSPSQTMQIAQGLYEGVEIQGQTVGLITYMRTDSTFIVPDVINEYRSFIAETWGEKYLPAETKIYKSKNHSQEAHEAIRPTTISLTPASLKDILSEVQWKLYSLIWERSLASQMASAQYAQTTLLVSSLNLAHSFRASGSILLFNGFLVLYEESKEEEKSPLSSLLPAIEKDVSLTLSKLTPCQHFTQPPARFSEASLVQSLEEQGIGRPSTYARILQVLQERNYVVLEKKRLFPTELGQVVSAFLCRFFARYVDYSFTAHMEHELDEVSSGKKPWKNVLSDFWPPFEETIQASQSLKITDVLKSIEQDVLGEGLTCPRCEKGSLSLRLSKMGPFVSCSCYPECSYHTSLREEPLDYQPSIIGTHPETGQEIWLKKGPYGWYIQHETTRVSSFFPPETLTFEQSLWLLSLPKSLGQNPETGQDILLGIGKFGPYLKHEKNFFSLRKEIPWEMTLEKALEIIKRPMVPRKKASFKKKDEVDDKSP